MQENFIEVYNLFDKDFCDFAINCFEDANKHKLTKNREEVGYNKSDADDLAFGALGKELPLEHSTQELSDRFLPHFHNAVQQYCAKYSQLQGALINSYSIKMQKTEPGQGYHVWHCEAGDRNNANRVMAWAAYLNDNFEAGETEFLYQQYRYTPKMGDLIIFPAGFTHVHRGNPPINGTKYIITGWLEF